MKQLFFLIFLYFGFSECYAQVAELRVTDVKPGKVSVDELVTVVGSGFVRNETRVYLSEVELFVEDFVSPSEIRVRVVRNAVSGRIRVEIRGEPGFAESPDRVIVNGPPLITQPTPPEQVHYDELIELPLLSDYADKLESVSFALRQGPEWLTLVEGGDSSGNIYFQSEQEPINFDLISRQGDQLLLADRNGDALYKLSPEQELVLFKEDFKSGFGVVLDMVTSGDALYVLEQFRVSRVDLLDSAANPKVLFAEGLELFAQTIYDQKLYVAGKDYLLVFDLSSDELIRRDAFPFSEVSSMDVGWDGKLYASPPGGGVVRWNGPGIAPETETMVEPSEDDPLIIKFGREGNFFAYFPQAGTNPSFVRKYNNRFQLQATVPSAYNVNAADFVLGTQGELFTVVGQDFVSKFIPFDFLRGTPTKADLGFHTVEVEASNAYGISAPFSFVLEVTDTIPPVLSSYTPALQTTEIESTTRLVLNFDEEIRVATGGQLAVYRDEELTPFLVYSDSDAEISVSPDQQSLFVDPKGEWPLGSRISLASTGSSLVTDLSGNAYAGFDRTTAFWTTVNQRIQRIELDTGSVSKTYGDPEFELGPAVSSTGLPVTYTASSEGVVSIEGNKARILSAGSTLITATQPGDASTQAAPEIPVELTVEKADLSLLIDWKSVIYGDADPRFTFTILEGLVREEDRSTLSVEFGSRRQRFDPPADYFIVPIAGTEHPNYEINFGPNGRLRVLPAPLAVKAVAAQKVYGAENPEFEVEYSGFKGSDAILEIPPVLRTGVGVGGAVGSYPITLQAGTALDPRYAIDFQESTLTINPQPLSITADAGQSKTYGQADPTLAFSSSGFVNGEDESLLTGALSREPGEAVGSYALTLGDLSAGGNYALDFTPANFVVNQQTLSITAEAGQSKTYGQADPTFTFSSSGFVNGEDESLLTGALSREAGEAVGSYALTLGDLSAGGNYTLDFTAADFVVNQQILSITADAAQSKTYGQVDPTFTFGSSGFVNGEDESLLTGALSREPGEDVGSYALTLGDLSAGGNYALDFTTADFVVNQQTLSITADAGQSKTYGEADPTFTFGSSGFVNGEDESLLTGALSREPGEDVGSYALTLGDLSGGGNYALDFTTADFVVNQQTLSITADAGQSKTYGESDPTFAFSSSGFVNGEDESLLTGALSREAGEAVGSYALTVGDLSAGGNYALDFTPSSFTINQQTLSITADAGQSKTYGEADPTFTFGSSGFVNGEDESLLTGALSRENGEAVGSYGLTLGDLSGGGNYTLDFTAADFVVNQQTLSITADAGQSKTYGEADPTFAFSSSGFVNGEDESLLTGALSREPGEAVGSYGLTLGDLSGGGNYTLDFTAADFVVNQQTLSITADAGQSKTYGESDPTFAFSSSGFVNGEDESLLTGALSREAGEAVGSYALTPGDLSAGGNYDLDFTPADFVVNQQTLSITADAGQSKTYGEADPTFAFSSSGFVNGEDESVLTGALSREPGEDVGSYALTLGDLSAGGNYRIAYSGTNFLVTKAQVRVLIDDKVKTYGSGNPDLTFAYSGLLGSDKDLDVPVVLETSVTEATGVGTYDIFVKQGTATDPNYQVVEEAGTLRVVPAQLTIIAEDKSRSFGEINPELTFRYEGLVAGDTKIAQEPFVLTRAESASGVGTYPITVEGGEDPNYAISRVPGTLTIDKGTPQLIWNAVSVPINLSELVIPVPQSNSPGVFRYEVGDEAVAIVQNGRIIPVSEGTTTLTAIQEETPNFGSVRLTVALTVTKSQRELLLDKIRDYQESGGSTPGLVERDLRILGMSGIDGLDLAVLNAVVEKAGPIGSEAELQDLIDRIQSGQDSDGDGVPDYIEIMEETDGMDSWSYRDADGDGVPDYVEAAQGSDPTDASSYRDSNGDGVPDYIRDRSIISLAEDLPAIGIGWGTADAASLLSDSVAVALGDGSVINAGVIWDASGLDAFTAGTYLLNGALIPPYDYRNGYGIVAEVTVAVDEKPTPQLTWNAVSVPINLSELVIPVPQSTSPGVFRYEVGDERIAIVQNGRIIPVSEGTTTLTAIQEETPNFGSVRLTVALTVTKSQRELLLDKIRDYQESGGSTPGLVERDLRILGMSGIDGLDLAVLNAVVEKAGPIGSEAELQDLIDRIQSGQDSDGDGVPDYIEIMEETDGMDSWSYRDADGDGVPDYVEAAQGSDPTDASSYRDSNGDGVPDYIRDRSIISLAEDLPAIGIGWGTADAASLLPDSVAVALGDGSVINAGVIWDASGLDAFTAGTYLLNGALIPPYDYRNGYGIAAEVTVAVGAKPAPTDIRLSNTIIPASPTEGDVLIGLIEIEDEFADTFRLSLPDDNPTNAYFSIRQDSLFFLADDAPESQERFEPTIRVIDSQENSFEKQFSLFRLSGSVTILNQDDPDGLLIMNSFSPNGDGINEEWVVKGLEEFLFFELQVFDRGGRRLFLTRDSDDGWDGTHEGQELPTGTYYYVIKIEDRVQFRKGFINLIRK
jgi:gliding motility-associated-like protein